MDASAGIVVAVVITVVVFLICREIVCWYWKVNRIEVLLEEIAANTKKDPQYATLASTNKSIE